MTTKRTSARAFSAAIVATRRELATARAIVAPLDAETTARIRERVSADAWDAMETETAAIAATIPALAEQLEELEARACPRCSGTGDYAGPTGHRRNGRPICFDCHGSGQR